jgi:acyl-CoA synthetase (NDP forming)
VVLKIVSPTIIHKTEVGGVKVVAKTLTMYIEGRLYAARLRGHAVDHP